MVRSFQKIEFVESSGGATLLLDFGDYTEEEIAFPSEQQSSQFNPIAQQWGIATSEGGARRTITFSKRKDHASIVAARREALYGQETRLYGKTGSLRISIRNDESDTPEIWLFDNAVLVSTEPRPVVSRTGFRTVTTYQVTMGKGRPIQGNFGNCFPIGMQTYIIGDDTTIFSDDECELIPPYVPPSPSPGDPGHLVPEYGVSGFTVSGIDSPIGANGHYSPDLSSGQTRWLSDTNSFMVKKSASEYELMPLDESELNFHTTNSPSQPWLGTWSPIIGSGLMLVTVDP